ncbi:MAG: DUF4199 domain-containing protein [Bacteroidia bacterium]
MNKVYSIFGVISGLISSTFLYFFYHKELYTMRENNLLFRSFSIAILALCVIFAIIAAKKINGNTISFMRSMFTGFMVSLISALVNFVCYSIIYLSMPQMLVKPEKIAKEQFQTNPEVLKDTTINISKALENIHTQFTPGGFLLPSVFVSLIFGLLASIFVTAFVYTRTERQV